LESAALHYVLAWEDPSSIQSNDGFARVKRTGTGFLIIRRRAIQRLCTAHPELRHSAPIYAGREPDDEPRWALFDSIIDPDSGEYLSED
jgi:hypothetical protein